MRPIRALAALALLLPATALVTAVPASAGAADTCTFDRAEATVTAHAGTVGFTYTIGREAGTSFLTFTSQAGTLYCLDGTRRATVRTTDTIGFVGTPSNEALVVSLEHGPLGPGKTPEAAGTSEIEIEAAFGTGTDTLYVVGSDGNDRVSFRPSWQLQLNGDADDDLRAVSADRRWVYAGAGHDRVVALAPVAIVAYGGPGDDVLRGSDLPDGLYGEEGDDALTGGGGDDSLLGGPGPDVLAGDGQNDYLVPGPGNDTADGGNDDDWFEAQPNADGRDVLTGGPGDEDAVAYRDRSTRIVADLDGLADDGEAGERDRIGRDVEVLVGGEGNDRLIGNAVHNELDGNGGADVLDGADGDDTLYGGPGDDSVVGTSGDDGLYGGDGDDTLDGGAGNDALTGNGGADAHLGRTGNDVFYADAAADGDDRYVGDAGRDVVSYAARSGAVEVDLDGVADDGGAGENDNVRTDVESVTGGSGADVLTGSSAGNTLAGGAGNDTLDGLGGEDSLYGSDGQDTIEGGEGTDYVVAGGDDDTVNVVDAAEDYADCGPGTDTLNEDVGVDASQGCEL